MGVSHDIDHELIRRIAREERDNGCADAPEIGRRIARCVAQAFKDGEDGAYENLVGLAALGSAYYGRSVLKENKLKITRRGEVITISGAYALPTGVVTNGVDKAQAATEDQTSEAPARTRYVQWGLLTWAEFHTVLELLRDRRGAIDATVTTFEEVAKLERVYPSMTVGEAIQCAGLDLTGRAIDLDSLGLAV